MRHEIELSSRLVATGEQNGSGFKAIRTPLLAVVGIVLLVLALEPALSWFVVPALLVGLSVALVLRSSSRTAAADRDEARPEIQIAKIPVKGGMGLLFTVGTIVIFCAALPEARWFLALAIPTGMVVGLALYKWHNRHP